MNLGVKTMSIFGNKKSLTINELSEESLRNLRNDIDKEINKRMELRNGTAENIAKKINELFNIKENKDKLLVYNSDAYVHIIKIFKAKATAYSGTITIDSNSTGVEYGCYDNTWERLSNYANQMCIYIGEPDENTIEKVKACLKTEQETLTIINEHLDKCCEDFKKHHLDIMKRRLFIK